MEPGARGVGTISGGKSRRAALKWPRHRARCCLANDVSPWRGWAPFAVHGNAIDASKERISRNEWSHCGQKTSAGGPDVFLQKVEVTLRYDCVERCYRPLDVGVAIGNSAIV